MTKKRTYPPSDRYAVCPFEGKILEFYEGHFDAALILLNPFQRPKKIKPPNFDFSEASHQDILNFYSPVTWKEVIDKTELGSYKEVDIGLQTLILGLKKKLCRDDYKEEILKFNEDYGIIEPREGEVSPFLVNKLMNAFESSGYHWLWEGDEFDSERKLRHIEDIKDEGTYQCHGSFFTKDHKILLTTHWDSFYSILASSKGIVDKILLEFSFEGIVCDPDTEIFWSVREAEIQLIETRK